MKTFLCKAHFHRKEHSLRDVVKAEVSSWQADKFALNLSAELGFTGIIDHRIQSGTVADKGDIFDYVDQGGQDVLFPFSRFQADLVLFSRHHVVLLYQPLTLETVVPIQSRFHVTTRRTFLTTDGTLELKYGFDFWRLSYLFDIIEAPEFYFGAGLSLQIRNASIVFRTSDGSKSTIQNNIGPVPIIKLKLGYLWPNSLFVEFEGDGFYASDRFFNGANYSFVGYIYDLSIRSGYSFSPMSTFYFNVRFLGGGAEGEDDDGEFTFNDLHTIGTTIGVMLHL